MCFECASIFSILLSLCILLESCLSAGLFFIVVFVCRYYLFLQICLLFIIHVPIHFDLSALLLEFVFTMIMVDHKYYWQMATIKNQIEIIKHY